MSCPEAAPSRRPQVLRRCIAALLGASLTACLARGTAPRPDAARAPSARSVWAEKILAQRVPDDGDDDGIAAITTVLNAALAHAGRPPVTVDWVRAGASGPRDGRAAAAAFDLEAAARVALGAFWRAGLTRVAVDAVPLGVVDLDGQAMLLAALMRQAAAPGEIFVLIAGRLPPTAALPPVRLWPAADIDTARRRVLVVDLRAAAEGASWLPWEELVAALSPPAAAPPGPTVMGYLVVRAL